MCSKEKTSAVLKRILQKRDLQRINAAATKLNAEAADVLEYQSTEALWIPDLTETPES
jgi:hypothetical protein